MEELDHQEPHIRRFSPSMTVVDIQLEHATYCSVPGHHFPGVLGWFINVGDLDGSVEEFFALSTIIAASR